MLRDRWIRAKNKMIITVNRIKLNNNAVTIISQNCIGGVFYHDMGLQFLSPTINLYFNAPDFIRFVQQLERYLQIEPVIVMGEGYPIGTLDDITIQFMHYDTCDDAAAAWQRRKKRIDFKKLLICSTDRDGFDDSVFSEWKKIPYSKLLFTCDEEYGRDTNSLFFPKYKDLDCVPDLIEKREFYKNGILISRINNFLSF